MTKKQKIIDAGEDVVEMGCDEKGTYRPIAIVKASDQSIAQNDAIEDGLYRGMPRWFPAAYEMMNGFVMGLGAIENFMFNVKNMNKRKIK